MVLEIKGKEYNVHFGLRFVRALDEKHYQQSGVNKFGIGLQVIVSELYDRNATTLSDVLYLGTITEKSRPGDKQVDEYVETHENIEKLFEEVLEELKKGNATKLKVLELVAELEENLAKLEEQKKLEELQRELEAKRIKELQEKLTKTS